MDTEWIKWVGAITGIYGAIVSTYNLIRQRAKDRPQLIIKAGFSAAIVDLNNGDRDAFDVFSAEAINIGDKPVTLEFHAFVMPDGKWLTFTEAQEQLPKDLLHGKAISIDYEAETIKKELKRFGYSDKVELKAVFKDLSGQLYFSKPRVFDLNRRCNGEGEARKFSREKWIRSQAHLNKPGFSVTVHKYENGTGK